ncbi:MAG: hypothetical protein ACRDUA_11310 [Micromonosporaceae bacterium]
MASLTSAGRRHLGVLAGALFVLLWLVGMFLQPATPYPRPTDSMATVQKFFQAAADSVERYAGVHLLAGVALLAFAGILAGHLRRYGRPGLAPYLAFAGGVVAAGTLLASTAATLSMATSDVTSDAAVTQALYQLSFWVGGPIHVVALGMMIAAAAYGLGGVVPKWLTIAGLVIGVAGVLAAFTAVVPMAVVFTPIGRFLGFLWLLVTTVMVALRRTDGGRDA